MAHMFENEVEKAVEWLVSALLRSDSTALADALRDALTERFEGHWYPDEPHRGCAFRSLTCNAQALDPVVARAVSKAKLQTKVEVAQGAGFILWVNPCEVKVLLDSGVRKDIFRAEAKASNPYSKPRVHIERTRLNVVAEMSPPSTTSPSPTGSPMLNPKAATFAPAAARSSADSESDSGDEVEPQPSIFHGMAHAPSPAPPPGLFMPPGMMPMMGMPPLPPQQMGWPAYGHASPVEAH